MGCAGRCLYYNYTMMSAATITIRPYRPDDWDELWRRVVKPVFRGGDTYLVPPDVSREQAWRFWVEEHPEVFVSIDLNSSDEERITGSYYLKPNYVGQGDHVANCGYMVAPEARGRGIASAMCEHSKEAARQRGYRAMQYNFVVSTNTAAVRLWRKHGFAIVGTLPGVFRHPDHGYVDAYVMHTWL